jgi:flagellar protein FliJ
MSAIESLIRLYRWQLDERKRHLADLEGLAVRLRQDEQRLEEENAREQALVATSPEAAYVYAGYARNLIERRRKLRQSQAEVAQQIVEARDALADAFQEMKRYEITAANRARIETEREGRRQQQALDDLGVEGFRRRNGEAP